MAIDRKSYMAFRTISEAATLLEVPTHVLRFWETKFESVTPLKRGGGRRYYRPNDISLLYGIKHFLYEKRFSIKKTQAMLRKREKKDILKVGKAAFLAGSERQNDSISNVDTVLQLLLPNGTFCTATIVRDNCINLLLLVLRFAPKGIFPEGR